MMEHNWFHYRKVSIIVVLAVSIMALSGLTALPGCGLTAAPEVGQPAPDFTLTDLDGNTVRLRDFRGKVVFLNFWGTWCPPCRSEMPEMEKLYQEYKEKGIVIIGVGLLGLYEPGSNVKDFVETNGYSWTFVIDTTGEVSREYMVTNIPSSFFIDEGGIIRATEVGSMNRATMENLLAEAMK